MKKVGLAVVLVSLGALVFVADLRAQSIREGKWSMTTTIRMEGMDDETAEAMAEMEKMSPEEKAMMASMLGRMEFAPVGGGMGMATTKTQCITNDNPVPEAEDEDDCEQTHTVKGNTVNFEVVCDDSHSTGEVTYKNDSMKGTIKSTETGSGQAQSVTIDIRGQFVGPCEGADAS